MAAAKSHFWSWGNGLSHGWMAVAKGHQVTVYNRTTEVLSVGVSQYSGDLARLPRRRQLLPRYYFTCVGNDQDVSEVVLGEQGLLARP